MTGEKFISEDSMAVPEVGTDIYYIGDMANRSGFGYVARIEHTRWGRNVTIQLHDGRRFQVSPASFMDSPGRRFITVAEREQQRKAAMRGIEEAAQRFRSRRGDS